MREEASRLSEVVKTLDSLSTIAPDYALQASDLASRLRGKANRLEERANEEEGPEPEYDEDMFRRDDDEDIRLIFSDL